jgi:hypothetical protein
MTESLAFDPELEGLLREIAADPGSRLLRMPRPTRPRGLLAIPEPVTRARAGLSVAERHLIEVHRDELADLLRRACLIRFFSDPQRKMYLNRSKTANEVMRLESPEGWRTVARPVLSNARASYPTLSGLDLIEACLRPGFGYGITITELARTSQVLQPTSIAEDYVGLDQVLSGHRGIGERILWQLIATAPPSYILSCAFETLGLSAGIDLNEVIALKHYRKAAVVSPERTNPLMSWLYFATRLEDRAEATKASAHLEAMGPIPHEVVSSFVSAHEEQDRSGAAKSTSGARELAEELRSIVGDTSRRVLDAV